MACEKCESRVQNCLNNIDGVIESQANHNENNVKIVMQENVSIEKIKDAIEEIGYEVE